MLTIEFIKIQCDWYIPISVYFAYLHLQASVFFCWNLPSNSEHTLPTKIIIVNNKNIFYADSPFKFVQNSWIKLMETLSFIIMIFQYFFKLKNLLQPLHLKIIQMLCSKHINVYNMRNNVLTYPWKLLDFWAS